jgi:chromosome partitioning protein
VAAISETCSVCAAGFDVQFRYQMEERDGGFSFYCSQKCLEKSQRGAAEGASAAVMCDACAKRFQPELVSQVLYVAGKRRYACSLGCRSQLVREAHGLRLGEIAPATTSAAPAGAPLPQVPQAPAARSPGATRAAASGRQPAAPTYPITASSLPPEAEALASPTTNAALSAAASPAIPAAPAPSVRTEAPRTVEPAVALPVMPAPASKRDKAPAAKASEGTPRYLAVFNHKGGTGKTTTAVSVAAGLAARGKRVLLVDTDAQGNVSVSLGATSERSLYHVLVMGLRVADAVATVRPNLDLLPSNETLAAAELYLAGRQNRDRVLCDRLAPAASAYDYVVLDCSPSLSLMNQNALVFADSVLVPVACDYLSLVGVRQVIKTVKNVNSLLHHPVQIWGVLPTFYDARANICREAVSTLKSHFGERCLPPIRAAIKVKEAPAQGQTIFEYAAGTNAAEDYGVVVETIVSSREQSSGKRAADEARAAATTATATATA